MYTNIQKYGGEAYIIDIDLNQIQLNFITNCQNIENNKITENSQNTLENKNNKNNKNNSNIYENQNYLIS